MVPEFALVCEYVRERKKRGKASRKGSTRQDQAEGSATNGDCSSEGTSPTQTAASAQDYAAAVRRPSNALTSPRFDGPETPRILHGSGDSFGRAGTYQVHNVDTSSHGSMQPSLPRPANAQEPILPDPNAQASMRLGSGPSPTALSLNGFSLYDRPNIRGSSSNNSANMGHGALQYGQAPLQIPQQQTFQSTADSSYAPLSPLNYQYAREMQNHASPSHLTNFFSASPIVGSPAWLNLSSSYQPNHRPLGPSNALRFPVLQPLLPYIESIIPISLACDLLELYFASSSTVHVHPVSPHILGYVFRKESFLTPNKPRSCSPALLASMLWLAAQTSESPFLTSPPSARSRVCQKLLEITIALLKPLVHEPPPGDVPIKNTGESGINGVALGGLGVAMTGGDQLTADGGAFGPLDNIPTYIHLASVVSASEYKAASMRWWNAAWTLARELKLGRELPPNPVEDEDVNGERLGTNEMVDGVPDDPTIRSKGNISGNSSGAVSEEEREERRRVWWM